MHLASCVCNHAVFVECRKKFVGGHECSMHCLYIYWSRIFFGFLKFKRGMCAVSSTTTTLRVCIFRISSVVNLVLAMNSLKMKQMVDFFVLQ